MAHGFRRARGGYRCRLEPEESLIVGRLAGELTTMLDSLGGSPAAGDDLAALVGLADEAPKPTDPVLERLFPDAYADAAEASEFRRFTQAELATGKRAALAFLRSSLPAGGGDVTVDEEGAQLWLTGLNDLRLALASRVGITDDEDPGGHLDDDDPRHALLAVYDFLSYLQGTLVEAVAGW